MNFAFSDWVGAHADALGLDQEIRLHGNGNGLDPATVWMEDVAHGVVSHHTQIIVVYSLCLLQVCGSIKQPWLSKILSRRVDFLTIDFHHGRRDVGGRASA